MRESRPANARDVSLETIFLASGTPLVVLPNAWHGKAIGDKVLSAEKWSRIEADGDGWDMAGSESSKPLTNHILSATAAPVNPERSP